MIETMDRSKTTKSKSGILTIIKGIYNVLLVDDFILKTNSIYCLFQRRIKE